MGKVFNLNNYNLSSSEVIRYAANGTLSSVPSEVFLNILQEYQSKIDDTEAEVDESTRDYDSGYDDGWASAVEEMQKHLNGM